MPITPQINSQHFRTGGSGFTIFQWMGKPIAFAQSVSHQSPQPVAAPVAIQPLDAPRPLQIITPAAIGPGTLQVQMYERYQTAIWDEMMAIIDNTYKTGTNRKESGKYLDLVEVFVRLANIGKGITCSRIIYDPSQKTAASASGNAAGAYANTYHNCTITDIRDDENIEIGTMEVVKSMTIMYTHVTRSDETKFSAGLGA